MARITVTIHSTIIGSVVVERFTGVDQDRSEHAEPSHWREEIASLLAEVSAEANQIALAASIVQEHSDNIANHEGHINVGSTQPASN